MPGRDPVEVTVDVGGQELLAGTLWINERGGQAATFRYADSYLASPDSYDLDPALPKAAGAFHTPPGRAMFNAFADSAPDRWGENLMRRAERERARATSSTPRTLGKADFLLGVRDDTRQGAIRFRQPGTGTYYSTHRNVVPRLIQLPRLAAMNGTYPDGRNSNFASPGAPGSMWPNRSLRRSLAGTS